MAGDDYGRPAQLPWAVAFTDRRGPYRRRTTGVPLHPVQLCRSVVCLLLFAALVRLARRKRFDGE
jgi:prolipoprotein diacylglyceryltransferase